MKEIERLKQYLQTLENPEPIPFSPYFDNLSDEGQTLEFIEWMKSKPESLQANFLSSLVPYRKECIPRLLEFSSSKNEEVSLIACEALIKIDEYYTYAKVKLHAAYINEIENHADDQRIMILLCLRDGFMFVAEKEGVEILHFFRNMAAAKNAATIVNLLDIAISGFE